MGVNVSIFLELFLQPKLGISGLSKVYGLGETKPLDRHPCKFFFMKQNPKNLLFLIG